MFLTQIPIHMKIGEKELRGRSGVCAISGVCATTLYIGVSECTRREEYDGIGDGSK